MPKYDSIKIKPLHEDPYHPKNCGWIHKDSTTLFAGLIYLNRVPEPDTGTDIYIEKDGYAWTEDEDTKIEHKHYSGEEVLDEDYIKAYNRVNGQYELSISFKNVFNRMIAYDSQVSHCARTFGKDQERLTLTFFFKDLIGSQPLVQDSMSLLLITDQHFGVRNDNVYFINRYKNFIVKL